MAAWELLPLDHVLDLLRGSDLLVCLDWKQPVMDPALASSLRAHRLIERTLVSSRAPAALADIKRQCPTLRVGMSVRRINDEAHAWEADAVMVDHESGSAEAVRQLQDRGIRVYLWTVADGQAFEQVWGWRPDGIMSDALEDHLALRQRLQSRRWSSSSSTGRSSGSPSG
jgi:glycerophosphoryl diester phosphodiesterase